LLSFAFVFAFAVGLVVSGMISAMWAIFMDEPPHLGLLAESDFLTPIRVLVVVTCAPTMLFTGAFGWAMERSPLSLGYLALGVAWSFFQGVFILTSVFNFT
jgi:hypothetical protein